MNHKLVAALMLLPLSLPAQDDPATPGPAGPSRRAKVEAVTVSMKFRGGTMAEFVEAVRDDQPKANIVLATKAKGALVPEIVLKDAGLDQALEGACAAAEAPYEVRVKEFRGAGQPVYSITASVRRGQAQSVSGYDPNAPMQRVFSLNELTGKQVAGVRPLAVRTVLSALELAMDGEVEAPRIRYHEDSGLLLVRGTNAQVQVVEDTLATLQQDMVQQANKARQIEAEQQQAQRAARKGQPK